MNSRLTEVFTMARNAMSSSLLTKVLAFGSAGFLTLYTTFVALYSQVFQDIMNQGIMSVSYLTMLIGAGGVGIAVFLGFVLKDTFDKGRWTGAEKKTFITGAVIMLIGWFMLRNIGAIATVNNATTPYIEHQEKSVHYWCAGGTDVLTTVFTEPQYLTIGAGDDAQAYEQMVIRMNQSEFTKLRIESYRGFNITLGDDGIDRVVWTFYDKDTATTTELLDSTDSEIDITDMGTYCVINSTWLYTTSVEMGAYTYDNIEDYHQITLYFTNGGDFDDTAAVTATWVWITSTAASNEDLISALILGGIGIIPAFLVMRQNNVFRQIKRSIRKAGIRL